MHTFGHDVAAALLGITLLIIVAGAVLLSLDDSDIPSILEIIGGAAVGALATLATTGHSKTPEG